MRVTIKPVDGLIDTTEASEIKTILGDEAVVGYSIFAQDGTPIVSKGAGETAIAVFSNIFERATNIGEELGEAAPRPSVIFSGRETELVGLPLANANMLILKEKTAGIRREYRHAG